MLLAGLLSLALIAGDDLVELKRLAAPLDPAKTADLDADEIRELLEANAKKALTILRRLEAAPPDAAKLNDARLFALRAVSHYEPMALDKEPLEVAKRLRAATPKGSEHAAEADLFLVSADIRGRLIAAKGGDDFKDAWSKHAESFRKKIVAYLDDHPKYVPAADALRGLLPLLELAGDTQTRDVVLRRVAENLPEHPLARVAALRLAVGKPFDMPLPASVGSLKERKGKVVLIHFWASWCVPCAVEVEILRELRDKHKEKIDLIGIALEEKEAASKRFLARTKADWKQVLGKPALELGRKYGIESLPTTLVIDTEGKLHSIDTRERLAEIVGKLLEK
ncbi:MAG: TlpA disulfide reductase family protein [Gemmataceae bacterium]